jgi:hypothetical protein
MYRLACNGDVAAGQLAVFQGGPSRTGGNDELPGTIFALLMIWISPAGAKMARAAPSSCLAGGPF